jgi:outer membrane protein OmpA-like peptidoglycan-associated protein
MKTITAVLLLALIYPSIAISQISLEKVIKKTEKKVEKRVEKKIDKSIDKGLNAAEDGIEEGVKSDKKTESKNTQSKPSDSTTETPATSPTDAPQEPQKPELVWNKYDFVPGTEIIFEDNQEGEQNGEFPSKWDLKTGTIENAEFDHHNVIYFRETGNFPNGILPLIENSSSDYLPDEFTIEFDCYFMSEKYGQNYKMIFYDSKNQKRTDLNYLQFYINNAKYGENEKVFPGAARSNVDKTAKWRHIAISFNKRALKVYMDDARLLNIPNITGNPTGITIGALDHQEGEYFIKNIRIAKGAVPLYDKLLTDGKFVTTGIKFDVAKASIKPESIGTINYVVKMMQDHPELKFSVEGHTDSDGDDAANQKLSEARAKAVMEKMIEFGIAKDRLKSKGHGESKPMLGNESAEGKAQNRRVEFVKF